MECSQKAKRCFFFIHISPVSELVIYLVQTMHTHMHACDLEKAKSSRQESMLSKNHGVRTFNIFVTEFNMDRLRK